MVSESVSRSPSHTAGMPSAPLLPDQEPAEGSEFLPPTHPQPWHALIKTLPCPSVQGPPAKQTASGGLPAPPRLSSPGTYAGLLGQPRVQCPFPEILGRAGFEEKQQEAQSPDDLPSAAAPPAAGKWHFLPHVQGRGAFWPGGCWKWGAKVCTVCQALSYTWPGRWGPALAPSTCPHPTPTPGGGRPSWLFLAGPYNIWPQRLHQRRLWPRQFRRLEAGGGGTGLAWRRGWELPCPTGITSTSLQTGAVSPPQGGGWLRGLVGGRVGAGTQGNRPRRVGGGWRLLARPSFELS